MNKYEILWNRFCKAEKMFDQRIKNCELNACLPHLFPFYKQRDLYFAKIKNKWSILIAPTFSQDLREYFIKVYGVSFSPERIYIAIVNGSVYSLFEECLKQQILDLHLSASNFFKWLEKK